MEPPFCTGSPKLNEITENKHSLVLISAATCWFIRKHENLDQSCLVPVIQATIDGLMVLYIVCWYALDPSHRQWSLDVASILWMKMFILLWPHLLIAASSRIMQDNTKLKSSQISILNMTVSLLYYTKYMSLGFASRHWSYFSEDCCFTYNEVITMSLNYFRMYEECVSPQSPQGDAGVVGELKRSKSTVRCCSSNRQPKLVRYM